MAAYKVLIPQDIMEEGKAYLRDKGYEIKMGSGITVEDIVKDVADCDAILARTAPFPAEVLEAGKKLKVIGRHGVGVDNIDVKKAEEMGIWVTNAPESNSNTVAEHALGLIIALAHNIVRSDKAFRAGDFEIRNRVKGSDLEGKVLGVLGMGKIGRLVAQKAYHGLGMKVFGYDPYLKADEFPQWVTKVDDWDEIFRSSDYLTIHIPATPKTKNSIGAKEFGLMKKSACIINAARGEVVDEPALVEALKKGEIAGAGLDVFAEEPPVKDHPFFSMDNVVVTPHNAALTTECMIRMATHAAQGIDEALNGKKPTWPVNNPSNPR
ncbi:phosphoglycerate dehydrogenase [Marispirochaeta aestuarii]|uniref:Phosphoglycerate dehydrogenase n=1 Tax=Marispirochaeta aestuarii TaxID=1963862 RepID=A0A1Y1S434_9SPIO|nr:hydroxyacid dehydrogenase [Marispirochaeta aestuarii]ORC38426.1 phosphoglycerate dehydrogenase [Marispirochaeta aestuarii]